MAAEIPDGAVIVARAIFNSSLWTMRNEDRILAITLIGLANWKNQRWFDGEKAITIKRGQLVRSLRDLAESAQISIKNTRTSLRRLEKAGFLARKRARRYTLITLPKYDFYQSLNNYSDSVGTKPGMNPAQPRQDPDNTTAQPRQDGGNKQEVYKENKGKEGEEGLPPNGSDESWERIRMAATRIRALFTCPDSLNKVMSEIEAACARAGTTVEEVEKVANEKFKKYKGQHIWFFTDTEWPPARAKPGMTNETREEKIKRLAGG